MEKFIELKSLHPQYHYESVTARWVITSHLMFVPQNSFQKQRIIPKEKKFPIYGAKVSVLKILKRWSSQREVWCSGTVLSNQSKHVSVSSSLVLCSSRLQHHLPLVSLIYCLLPSMIVFFLLIA